MGITVNVEANENIRVTDQLVDTEPPSQVGFAVEGTITMTPELLEPFAGASLKPTAIELAVAESQTVTVDLSNAASLRLESVDVGVETPETGDLSPGVEASSTDDGSGEDDPQLGAIAFTVEGAIKNVPAATLESLSEPSSDPAVESITFAVEDPVRSDGGSGNDVVLEIALLGYGITVYRDGTIDIGTDRLVGDVGLL